MREPLIRKKGRCPVTVLQTCPVRGLVCCDDARRLNSAVMDAVDLYRRLVLAEGVNKIREDAAAAPAEGLDIRTIEVDNGNQDRD